MSIISVAKTTLGHLADDFRKKPVHTVCGIAKFILNPRAWSLYVKESNALKTIRTSPWFNAAWYLRENIDVRKAGMDPAIHYLRYGAKTHRNPGPDFITDEYLALNPDVRNLGMNPLLHFSWWGNKENRLVSFLELGEPSFPDGTGSFDRTFGVRPIEKRRNAVFASYSGNGRVEPYVLEYLKGLKTVCDNIVFVSDNPLFPDEADKLATLVSRAIVARHGEYDFGSYKRGYFAAKEMGLLGVTVADELVIANDSCYAPFHPFEPIFAEMGRRECDFWGMSSSIDFGETFLQSFFFDFKRRALDNPALEQFMSSVTKLPRREDVVLQYESRFTRILSEAGLTWDAWVPFSFTRKGCHTPTKRSATLLSRYRYPLLKVKTVLGSSQEPPEKVLAAAKKANPELFEIILPHHKAKLEGTRKLASRHPRFSVSKHTDGFIGTIERIHDKIRNGGKARALFLVSSPSMFPAKPLFDAMLADGRFEPMIAVIPDLRWHGQDPIVAMKRCEDELRARHPGHILPNIRPNETGDWPDICEDADFVCYPSPYDLSDFHFNPRWAVGRSFLAIHVNYGFYRSIYDRDVLARQNYAYFWKVFFECDETIEEYRKYSITKGTNAELTGYVKMDGLAKAIAPKKAEARKTVLICPHHSVEGGSNDTLALSNFLALSDYLLRLPKRFPQLDFILRPHPFLFTVLAKPQFWGQEKIDAWKAAWLSNSNASWSSEGDYFPVFAGSDACIHDCGSYLVEYFYTGKPQCYLLKSHGDIEAKFAPLGKECLARCDLAFSAEDIEKFLNDVVIGGHDLHAKEREAFRTGSVMVNYPHAAERALDAIAGYVFDLDDDYYMKNNQDVAKSGMSAIKHYTLFGRGSGRKPRLGEIPEITAQTEDDTIVFIDRTIPTPNRDSGSVRMAAILDIMRSLGKRIVFIAHFSPTGAAQDVMNLKASGISFLQGKVDAEFFFKKNAGHVKTVWISRPDIADIYMPILRECGVDARILYDTVDLHFLRLGRQAEIEETDEARQKAAIALRKETEAVSAAHRVIAVSEDEKAVIERQWPGTDVTVISNIHEAGMLENDFGQRKGLLFIGGFAHAPNLDAMLWFAESVMPIITKANSDIRLTIIGSNPPKKLLELESPAIHVAGFAPDADPAFADARVFVSPLRYGAGIKGKIGQAMSLGLPVVTTSIGAEGMKIKDGTHALVADSPADFAAAILRLYGDEGLWHKLRDNAARMIGENFGRANAEKAIRELLAP